MIKDLEAIYGGPGDPKSVPTPKPQKGLGDALSGYVQQRDQTPNTMPNAGGSFQAPGLGSGDYEKYFQESGIADPKLSGQSIEMLAGQRQGVGNKLVRRVMNITPNVVAGLTDIVGNTGALLTELGDERNYRNGLNELADGMKNPFGQVYHRDNDTWAIHDPTWWIDHAGNTIETGITYALLGRFTAGAAGGAARGISAAADLGAAGTRLMMGAAEIGNSAFVSYTFGAQAGAQVYQETYETQLRKAAAKGLQGEEAVQYAKHIAAQSAASAAQLTTAVTMGLNIGSYAHLFRSQEGAMEEIISKRLAVAEKEAGRPLSQIERAQVVRAINPATEAGLAHRAGWKGALHSAVEEGAEEVLQQFAQQTGTDLGKEGKTRGFFEQFKEIEHLFDRTANAQGLLSLVLGAGVGGVQHYLSHNVVKSRRAEMFDSSGAPIPVIDSETGEEKVDKNGKPVIKKQWVTPRKYEHDMTQRRFASMQGALAAEFEAHQVLEDEYVAAVKAGKTVEADALSQQLFFPTKLHAIKYGLTAPWIKTFEEIGELDNEQVDEEGKTEAMRRGFAMEPGTGDHKTKAQEAIKGIQELKKLYESIQARYGARFNGNEHMAPYVDMLFARQADLQDWKKRLDTHKKTLADSQFLETQLAEGEPDFSKNVQTFNTEVESHQAVVQELLDDHAALMSASARNDDKTVEKLLRKYRAIGVGEATNRKESVKVALTNLEARAEESKAKVVAAQEKLFNSPEYMDWSEKNPTKDFQAYVDEVNQRQFLNMNNIHLAKQIAVHEAQYDIAKKHLDEMAKEKNAFRFTKKMDAWQQQMVQEQEAVEEARATQLSELARDKTTTTRLQRLELNDLADKYAKEKIGVLAQVQENNEQIQKLQKELAETRRDPLRSLALKRMIRKLQKENEVLQKRITHLDTLEQTYRVDTTPDTDPIDSDDLSGDSTGKVTVDAADAPSTETVPVAPTVLAPVNKADDTHLKVSSDVKTALANGRKKQYLAEEDGKTVVKEDAFDADAADAELDRLEALAEKGRLTAQNFGSSYFGQATDINTAKAAGKQIETDAKGFIQRLRAAYEGQDAAAPAVQIQEEIPEITPVIETPEPEDAVFTDYADALAQLPKEVAEHLQALVETTWRNDPDDPFHTTPSLNALNEFVAKGLLTQGEALRAIQLGAAYAAKLDALAAEAKAAQEIAPAPVNTIQFSQSGRTTILFDQKARKFQYQNTAGKDLSLKQSVRVARKITPSYFPNWYRFMASSEQRELFHQLQERAMQLADEADRSGAGETLRTFLMRQIKGTKFTPVTGNDLTDTGKTWIAEKAKGGIPLDTFVTDYLGVGNTEFPEQSEIYQAGFGLYDEQEIMNEIKDIMMMHPRGITEKTLREATVNPVLAELEALEQQFLEATGLDLVKAKDAYENIKDEEVYDNEEHTDEEPAGTDRADAEVPGPDEAPGDVAEVPQTGAGQVPGNARVVVTVGPGVPETPRTIQLGLNFQLPQPYGYHGGLKVIDYAETAASSTIHYREEARNNSKTGEREYVIMPEATKLNLTPGNIRILDPKDLGPSTKIRFEIDVDYDGPRHDGIDLEGKRIISQEKGTDYLDENRKIKVTDSSVLGNVPIKIVDATTGETISYLRTLNALEMRAPDTDPEDKEGYRNIVPFIETKNGIIDNLAEQRALLLEARQAIAEKFNRDGTGVESAIQSKGTGHLILNRVPREGGENFSYEVKQLPAWNLKNPEKSMLPEDVELVITPEDDGTPHSGLNYETTKPLGFSTKGLPKGSVGALVKASNGSYLWAPLRGNKLLDEKSESSRELRSTVRALELYLLNDGTNPGITKEIQALQAATGFNVGTPHGLKGFLNQYYTYTQPFKSPDLSPNVNVDGQEVFLFDIDTRDGVDKTKQIKIGFTMRGAGTEVYANLKDGSLHPAFIQRLAEGFRTRSRAACWTNPALGIKGINSKGTFKDAYYQLGTGKWEHPEYPSYNHFLKAYSRTEVYGRNQLPDGTYVYTANPNLNLQLPDMRHEAAIVVPNEKVETLPPVPEKPPVTSGTDAFDDLFGLGRPAAPKPVASIATAPEGARELTLGTLADLYNFTPEAERNGKTPLEVYQDLTARGHSFLAEGFNPFTRCL